MDQYLLNYLNSPFKSTKYNQIGFTVPLYNFRNEKKKKKQFRSISFQEQNKAITFPKLNNSFFYVQDQTNQMTLIKEQNIKLDAQYYLKKILKPENAAKSKLVRDKDYRKQIVKLMKDKQ